MRPPAVIVLATASLLFFGGASLYACVGSEPDVDSPTSGGDAATGDAPASAADAAEDASGQTDAAGGPADAGIDACGAAKDQSPCGCGGSDDCCLWADGGTECFAAGNAPNSCMSGPHRLIACVGRGSCAADQTCCVVGKVVGGMCPTRLERWDTACNPDGPDPCGGKGVLCASDTDCALADAGTCTAAVMDGLERPMGICAN